MNCMAVITTAVACLSAAAMAADPSTTVNTGTPTLYHVVSLKFKENATPKQIAGVESAFAALKDKIPGVKSLTWGDNVSPENHAKGFTECFVLTFASAQARDAYLVHPEHKAFGKLLGPIMDDVFVIDFWGK